MSKRSLIQQKSAPNREKNMFRGIIWLKQGFRLKSSHHAIGYTTASEHVLHPLKKMRLDPKTFVLHSLRAERDTASANLGVNDKQFRKYGRWKSEKENNNYVHEGLKRKLSLCENLAF